MYDSLVTAYLEVDSVDDGVGLVDGVVAVKTAAVRHSGAPVDVVSVLFCHLALFLETFFPFFFTLFLFFWVLIIAFFAFIDRSTSIPAVKCHVEISY